MEIRRMKGFIMDYQKLDLVALEVDARRMRAVSLATVFAGLKSDLFSKIFGAFQASGKTA